MSNKGLNKKLLNFYVTEIHGGTIFFLFFVVVFV